MRKRRNNLIGDNSNCPVREGHYLSQYPKLVFTNSHKACFSPKEQQLERGKAHAKEIEDFVKSLSPKVESVQIAWDETQWEEVNSCERRSSPSSF